MTCRKALNTFDLKFITTLLALIVLMSAQMSCQQGNSSGNIPADATDSIPADTIPQETVTPMDTLAHIFTTDYVMGRFDPAEHPDFTLIDNKYASREGMYLRKDAYAAFLNMYEHALKDGIQLQIRSATRNFYAQKGIWEAKWTGERKIENGENLSETTPDPVERARKILRYSSMPGSSRHHWGTDIDLNNLENDWFDTGEGLTLYKWLQQHAHEYGYCQTYTAGRPYGYFEERWHWTYTPVSARLTAFAEANLKNEMIEGFLGSESAVTIDVVKHYVLGINQQCNKLEARN